MILLTEENVINETKEYLEGGLYSNSLNGFISDFTELFLLLMIIGLSLRLIIGGIKAINEENEYNKEGLWTYIVYSFDNDDEPFRML